MSSISAKDRTITSSNANVRQTQQEKDTDENENTKDSTLLRDSEDFQDELTEHGSDGSSEAPESNQRVVMIYDDEGNATPMPMGNFYHDSVQMNNPDFPKHANLKGLETTRTNDPKLASEDDIANNDLTPLSSSSRKKNINSGVSGENEKVSEESPTSANMCEQGKNDTTEDRFRNQFMRIEARAVQLKDVSKVKKDVNHDKPKKRGSVIGGLHRAVSAVNIGTGDRNRTSAQRTETRQKSAADQASIQMTTVKPGTSSSHPKEKDLTHENKGSEQFGTVSDFPDSVRNDHLQRARENRAERHDVRQGLGAVGRKMSMRRRKDVMSHSTADNGKNEEVAVTNSSTDRNQPRTSNPGAGPAQMKSRVGLSQVGRMLSINRKKAGLSSADSTKGKQALASLPARDEKPGISSGISDRERSDDRRRNEQGSRMGLSRMGRMFSMTRTKTTFSSQEEHAAISQKPEVSPISSSSVSSSEGQSTIARSQVPSSINSSARREGSRMGLKAAGRMLSFSRKSKKSSTVPANHEGRDNIIPGRTLLTREDVSAEKRIQTKRTQSVPPPVMEGTLPSKSGRSEGKLNGRADNFTFAKIISPSIRASSKMGHDSQIRVPVMALAEYSGPVSRTKWYIDCFTLPHNAVRTECIDLYKILTSIASCGAHGEGTREADISGQDLDLFMEWWHVASNFFKRYFAMERDVLFPWVDQASTTDWEVQIALKKMRSMKEKLEELLKKADGVWNDRHVVSNGDLYALIYRAVDEFVPRLVNYFADQEVLLPAIVRGFYRLEDRLKMDRDMVAIFMGGDVTRQNRELAHHNIVLLVRWIENRTQLHAWNKKNLTSKAREQYGRWCELFEQQHYHIVKLFQSRGRMSRS